MNAHAISVTDDHQMIVQIDQPAQRIISLAPDLTEILFAIGASAKIKGVIAGSDFPDAARKLPIVGSYSGLDLERIVLLHPDLVVTWSNLFPKQIQILRKLGIPVYTTEPRQLEDVPRTMRNLGLLIGQQRHSEQVAQAYMKALETLRQRYAQKKQFKVFYQLGAYSLMTINKKSWINQAIDLCGGQNVFAHALSITPEVSWEVVVTANPEIIITDATHPDWKKRWQKWPEIVAVKEQHLFSIPPDWIDRAGPRLILGVAKICSEIDSARHH